MKKEYKTGDTLVMRIRKDEKLIMEWAQVQSELGDSIRFLIEQEIQSHGIKDLSTEIMKTRKILPTSFDIAPKLLEFLYKQQKDVAIGDAYQEMAEVFELSDEEKNKTVRTGTEPQWKNNVRWAKQILQNDGFVFSVQKGVWRLTDTGKIAYEKDNGGF